MYHSMLNKLFSWLTAFAGVRTNSWCGCSLRVIAAFCFLSSQMLLADFPQARLATIYDGNKVKRHKDNHKKSGLNN